MTAATSIAARDDVCQYCGKPDLGVTLYDHAAEELILANLLWSGGNDDASHAVQVRKRAALVGVLTVAPSRAFAPWSTTVLDAMSEATADDASISLEPVLRRLLAANTFPCRAPWHVRGTVNWLTDIVGQYPTVEDLTPFALRVRAMAQARWLERQLLSALLDLRTARRIESVSEAITHLAERLGRHR